MLPTTTENHFNLRWFTPEMEVPLCGHATLAAAHAICLGGSNSSNSAIPITFETLSGVLTARKLGPSCAATIEDTSSSDRYSMDFPLIVPSSSQAESFSPDFEPNSKLIQCACGGGSGVGDGDEYPQVQEIVYAPSLRYLVIVLKGVLSEDAFKSMQPDINGILAAHSDGKLVGVILTIAAATAASEDTSKGYDFYSRFFGPWAGINEDPVTGSAHSVLAPFWAEKLGKTEMVARQCSKRGGTVGVKVNRETERVEICGSATCVIRGEMILN